MSDIFIRTLSQGLQAFLPIAFALAWARRNGRADQLSAIRWGLAAAGPVTIAAGYLFQRSVLQARWEAGLASVAAALALGCGVSLWRRATVQAAPRGGSPTAWWLSFFAATILIVTRQTMEIEVVFIAAVFELRSLDATLALCGGAGLALALAWAWTAFSRALPGRAFARATSVFAGLFLVQALMYTLHESAEARLLPWSEILHAATEPYGPDGVYGHYVSYLLVALPFAAAGGTLLQARLKRAPVNVGKSPLAGWRAALATIGVLGLVGLLLTTAESRSRTVVPVEPDPVAAAPSTAMGGARPHLMFRHTGIDSHYNMLSMVSLDPPGFGRTSAKLGCERISFAATNGICLQAERGVFTTYKAVLFDRDLKARTSFKLDGSPSRTRISADGRVGAITVFVTGQSHGYAGSGFSTKTTLIDMASGDELGDLEQFTTWQNGSRFQSADFNFWGVTFARDSNVFYASLKTAGKTYLVRGDLGLRKLTVLYENVECPSISPDNHLIAYKKRVGGDLSPWRLYLLNMTTMTERALAAEKRSVDDQIEWLDDSHVLYGMPRSSQSAITDTWIASVDGDEPARVFLKEAESPIAIH